MSIKAMLEVAKTQGSIASLADALAIQVDTSRLSASTEIVNDRVVKFYIENASADETVAILNNCIDDADIDINTTIIESACGSCAIVIFNDDENGSELASLETAGVIDVSAKRIEDDEDDDPAHIAEEDDDVDGLPDLDEDGDVDEDDANKLKILADDDTFRLVTRLYQTACGNNKQEFAHFLTRLDGFLNEFRNRTGYDPKVGQENASADDFESFLADFSLEVAKKKKGDGFRKGRGGFLSAYMRIVGKRGDDLADAWDALDIDLLTNILSDIGSQLLEKVQEERIKRGLDEEPKEENPPAEETDDKVIAKVTK